MLDNHGYNLMTQLVEEHRSLWRIRDAYIRDSGGCQECIEVWQRLAREKENQIRQLEALLRSHIEARNIGMAA